MNFLYTIALLLVIIGALNWGAHAANFNLVTKLVGNIPYAEKAVYYLVALAGVYVAIASLTSESQLIRNQKQRKY
jgi:uncharacterized membrane protein YuzA (DUF378 family)